jgi:Homoserine dehydrogenase
MENIRVHAVEGMMLSSHDGLEKLLEIYKAQSEENAVFVLSPLHNGELSFYSLLLSAREHDEKMWSQMEKVQTAWEALTEAVLTRDNTDIEDLMDKGFAEIEDILQAVWLLSDISDVTEKHFASRTSYFLALIAATLFKGQGVPAQVMDVSRALKSHNFPVGVTFVYGILPQTKEIGQSLNVEGESEYASSLIAAEIKASLTFWNNRSLFCSAQIKDVPSAHVIRNLSYAEATELSFFGAPIVHPHFFAPAFNAKLPISLRFWGDIEAAGTVVSEKAVNDSKTPVKAFSVVRNVSIINLEGFGLSGVPGISSRLFSSLRKEKISVSFISQASSEYSICFTVPSMQMLKALRTVKNEFAPEIESGAVSSVSSEGELAIIAAVGESMTGSLGVAGLFFSALAKAGVNIRAIAQGSSERNISAVISANDYLKALRALHSVFFLSEQTLSIGLIGPGNIGGTLLDQIGREAAHLKNETEIDIRIRGIASSRKMLLSESGFDLSSWREEFEKHAEPLDMKRFLSHIGASYYPHAVLVDCTTSQALAEDYVSWLRRGFHVITPNKKAATASFDYYEEIFATAKKTGKRFLYETTVGAGLPVINTLNDLVLTGDKVQKIEGIVSGTLAWLFSNYDGTVPFSSLVLKAKELGFTEPDPRDDLSGMDVARKTVILARELGYPVEVSDLDIMSLVPESLRATSKDEFLSRLTEMDEIMLEKLNEAKAKGMKLRYVGKVDGGKCSVALELYPENHPFAQAEGTDNVIAFTTSRYKKEQPLVIKGPGAGPEVTAGGVFADILRLSAYLGAKL